MREPVEKPLKVLQLVTQLEPAGAQSMARWLHDSLREHFDLSTFFLYEKSPYDLFPNPELIVKQRPRSPREMVRFLKRFRQLRNHKPDVVVAHTHFSIALATLLWRRDPRVALIPVHHWPLDRYPRLTQWIMLRARKRNQYVEEIYVSPAVVDRQPATVIPNPVPCAGPYTDTANIPADIIIVARHAEEKSIDTAIATMSLLDDRHLTLVGGGPLTEQLGDQAKDTGVTQKVTFAGRLTNPEVRNLMRSSRIFLLPSLWEAMPVSLLEAVAEDCVIIVSNIDTHQFLLKEGAAIGFTQGDPQSLAKAIAKCSEPETIQTLSEGRERIRAAYAGGSIASQWVKTIQQAGDR